MKSNQINGWAAVTFLHGLLLLKLELKEAKDGPRKRKDAI